MKSLTIAIFVDRLVKGKIESLEDLGGTLVKGLPISFERKGKKYRTVEVSFKENKVRFEEINKS